MRWLRVAVIGVVTCLCSVAWAESDLAAALENELKAMKCPGALVGVQVGNEPPQVFVLGVADVESKAPMQRDFNMRVASVSKLFIGTAVLLLADEGKLSLDDPVSKYVDGVPGGDKITIRQLGNNTSCLFNSIENKEFQAIILANPQKKWTTDEILKYAFIQPPYHEPGTKFRYSNTNAVLLGQVIEKITGKSYAEYINERLVEPLKLQHTGYVPDVDVPSPASKAYRHGYPDKWLGYGDTFYDVTDKSASWSGAAGNMYSTVDDLLSIGKTMLAGKLLSEAMKKEMRAWVPTGYEEIQYGFCLGEQKGCWGHFGDVPGYSSYMGYFPAKDTLIVSLSNLSNNADGSSPAEKLRDVVIKELNLSTK